MVQESWKSLGKIVFVRITSQCPAVPLPFSWLQHDRSFGATFSGLVSTSLSLTSVATRRVKVAYRTRDSKE